MVINGNGYNPDYHKTALRRIELEGKQLSLFD